MEYVVGIPEVHYVYVTVEADSKEQAKKAANQAIEQGVDDLDPEYSHTLETDKWTVEEI